VYHELRAARVGFLSGNVSVTFARAAARARLMPARRTVNVYIKRCRCIGERREEGKERGGNEAGRVAYLTTI